MTTVCAKVARRMATSTNAAGVAIDTRTYDDGDRVIEQTDALGAATRSTYDTAGRLVTRTDRNGHVTRLTYDATGQLATIDDGQQRQRLRYDAAGRVIERQQEADGTTQTMTFQYDAADRITVVETSTPELTTRARYGYDALDRRIERGVSLNGGPEQVTRYAWNDAHQLVAIEVGDQRTTFIYDDAGRLISQTLPNGIEKTLAWDAADQLQRLTYTTGTGQVIEDLRYTVDAAGRRIKKESLGPTVRDTPMTATYDAANRMTALVMAPGSAQERRYRFTHDAAGQLLEKVRVDASGQPTTGPAAARTTYTWNSSGQLQQIVSTTGDGDTARSITSRYRYDPLGRRIERVIERRDGAAPATRQTTRYAYDGLQAIAEVREGADNAANADTADSGQAVTTHLLTGLQLDELIARQSTGSLQVALTDALGSVLAMTEANGQITASWAYSPYGETVAIGPSLDQPNQYTGREHDEGTTAEPGTAEQVYYYRTRYYLPGTKRFISEDPIGIAGGINVYGYVGGDPISYIDPTGEFGVVGGVIGTTVEIGMQAYGNYQSGHDILAPENYDWWDVGAATLFGAMAPGWVNVAKTSWKSGGAIRNLTDQLSNAKTLNRISKIEARINNHTRGIASVLFPQIGFQAVKAIAKSANGDGSKKNCDN